MDRKDLEILSRFDAVWQRVEQEKNRQADPSESDSERLMEGMYERWQSCRRLAACASGMQKKRLMRLSEQIKKHFQVLQLHYFLKSGDIYIGGDTPKFASYTPYNLRKLWQSTVENSEWMKNCNLNDNPVLVAELERIKLETDWQKKELEELIGELLQ